MNIARQYEEHKKEFDEAVMPVFYSGNYIGGPIVKQFEENFAKTLNVKYCVSCGNGTDALVIALRALGIGQGDEVITVSFTFFATSESISAVGATPVFVDVDENTYCMNANLIEKKITPRTKAILPVHFYGNVCDMDKIMSLAKKYNLYVIEDCAQATKCKYKDRFVGTIGDIGCFSFFPTKILGCAGDGGAIVSNNKEYADACRSYKMHGSGLDGVKTMKKAFANQGKSIPSNMVIADDKYHNYLIGYNSRLDAIQAALLNVKLKYLDNYIERRRHNASLYNELLKGSSYKLPYEPDYSRHGYYVYAVCSNNAKSICEELIKNGVEVHTYYPVPLHLQGVYAELGYKKGDLPVTEYLSEHTFAIPVYPEISEEEIRFVVSLLLIYEKEVF